MATLDIPRECNIGPFAERFPRMNMPQCPIIVAFQFEALDRARSVPFVALAAAFGFTVYAMILPLVTEFDVALGRTTTANEE